MNQEELTEDIKMCLNTYTSLIADAEGWSLDESDQFYDYMLGMTLAYLTGNVEITELDIH